MFKTCSHCSSENPGNARFCSQCGNALTKAATVGVAVPAPRRFSLWLITLSLVLLFLMILAGAWMVKKYSSRPATASAAALQDEAALDKPASTPMQKRKTGSTSAPSTAKLAVEKQCADNANFFTRELCISRLCHQPEHAREPQCAQRLEAEERSRRPPGG